MSIAQAGKGQLVRTGRSSPRFVVDYKIGFASGQRQGTREPLANPRRPFIDSVESEDGQELPMGDCDLIVGKQLIRVRHSDRDPEWLILSSNL
jgi:hypothetical protein